MKLEQQVISLELAQKLKELGVKQNSYFCHNLTRGSLENTKYTESHPHFKWCSAFTVAELGEMLWNIFEKNGWKLIYKVYGDVFGFKGTSWIGELGIVNLMRDPDMSAKMLVYLLENKLIAPHTEE